MWVWSECMWGDGCMWLEKNTYAIDWLNKPRCPQFLHTSYNGLISACVKSRIHLIQSCHYRLHFLHELLLSPFHAYISSESVLHSPPLCCHTLYTSSPPSSNLSSPHLHLQLCCSPLSFISIFLMFFLLAPTHLASNPLLTCSFNTHSFGYSSNSSAHILVTSLHAQFFSMYLTSAFDMPFKLCNLTSPHPKSARHRSKFS